MLDMDEIHLTRLATWFVQTIGKAILAGFGAGFVCAVIGAATDDLAWIWIGSGVAPAAAGFYLWTSTAPLPELEDDDEDEAAASMDQL